MSSSVMPGGVAFAKFCFQEAFGKAGGDGQAKPASIEEEVNYLSS